MRLQRLVIIILAVIVEFCNAFAVLPYVQIDFRHFFRLAQCTTKCTEMYGVPIRRRLFDGTYQRLFNTTNDAHKYCELGCSSMRRKSGRSLPGSLSTGAKFWEQSSSRSGISTTPSPVSSVEVGCMNLSPIDSTDYEESVEALVFIRLKNEPGIPLRFIIQWKQRTYAFGSFEESHWITASVESDRVFRVDGMVSGVQYRFLVTAVGPAGSLGNPVLSNWVDALSLGQPLRSLVGPLTSTVRFNSEDGMSALIQWNNDSRDAAQRDQAVRPSTPLDSCYYRIVWTNETHQQTHSFTLDGGNGFLLRSLAFDANYTVTLNVLSSVAIGDKPAVAAQPLLNEFKTLGCAEVFGRGSLNCAPEPVTNLSVRVSPNGTASVEWDPAGNTSSVLIYQVYYESVTADRSCMVAPQSIYVPSTINTYKLRLPAWQYCEYLFRVVNYDLLGRDAFAEVTVTIDPLTALESQVTKPSNLWLFAILIVIVPICAIVFRLMLSRKCGKKVLKNTKKDHMIAHV